MSESMMKYVDSRTKFIVIKLIPNELKIYYNNEI